MLVLSRKNGQKLIINDNIVITIIDSSSNTVKIGIEAPTEVKIYREEIYLEIKHENLSSKNSSPDDLASLSQFMKKAPIAPASITIKNDGK